MQTLNILFGFRARVIRSLFLLALALGLIACSGESTTVEGDVSVAYVKRPVGSLGNPTDAVEFTEGGDLYMREKSSPSAPETNLTGSLTNGHGDVSDPEVSYDGTKILFAMRCVTGASNSCLNPDGSGNVSNWRIWEYNIPQKSFTRISCTAASGTTPPGDDVDPAYLPDGRIVFVSNRQVKSQQTNGFAYLDEYERERTTTLHVMDSNGQNCHQISYNQSHDRNPTVLQSGEIMYSRWDHVGERNQFSIFFANPDGTSLFVFYGAHSPGNSYLHPREMSNGQVLSSLMPLSGTHEGGALMAIDIRNYSEKCEPQSGATDDCNGQRQPTARQINFGMGISEYGRYSTPYPLWDGTNRALVSWAPSCSATNSCATVANPLTGAQEISEEESTPVYGVYMLDLNTGTTRPVVPATVGANGQPTHSVLDPVAIQPRPRPNIIEEKDLTQNVDGSNRPLYTKTSTIGTIGVGTLSVKSVYDTDSLERMGNAVLVNGESIPFVTSPPPAPELCLESQPILSRDSVDYCRCRGRPRIGAPDICALKNPTVTHAGQRPARFVRVTRAIPTEGAISREVIGETDFEMQQILGYAPIEPDGSFMIEVPADIPIALTVTDAAGRGFTPHTSWIQVRPGETRTCNGCHSPRRGSSLNPPGIAGNHAYSLMPATGTGQSMAETRVAANPSASVLNPNMIFTDVWTDTTEPDVIAAVPATRPTLADPEIRIEYTTTTLPAVPTNGVIDYPLHIQRLWEKNLPTGNTCISCHNNNDSTNTTSRGLDLTAGTQTGSGRLPSYDELLIGDPILEGDPPRPRLIQNENALVVARGEAQVIPGASRASHLMEVLFRQELKSALPLVSTIDHSVMLNAAEKRLIAEWIDIGAQYYNSPRDPDNNNQPRAVTGLSQNSFHTLDPTDRDVHAALLDRCGTCHRAFGQTGTPNATFVGRRFVLTGATEGDFNATLSMLRDVRNPALNDLLRRPASTGTNPTHATTPSGGAILPPGDSDYRLICNWIRSGSTNSNPCPP